MDLDFEHTPKPWFVNGGCPYLVSVQKGHVFDAYDDHAFTASEKLHNIRLAAAAPDMKDALIHSLPDWWQDIVDHPEEYPDGMICCEISNGDVKAILAALKKAREG